MIKPTIIITGISSFLGLHLAKELSRSARIIGTTTSKAQRSNIELARIEAFKSIKHSEILTLDLEQKESVDSAIKKYRPHVFIYHAGYTKNYTDEDLFDLKQSLNINVHPLKLVIPLLKENGCEQVIITGSSVEYGNSDSPHCEDEACFPKTSYGLSKLFQTQLAAMLSENHALQTTVVRVFNTFGAFDDPKKVFPYVIESIIEERQVDLSPCTQIRSFLSAKQIAEIYAKVIDKRSSLQRFEIFNATSDQGLELKKLVSAIPETLSKNLKLLNFGAKTLRDNEVMNCIASSVKLKNQLSLSFSTEQTLEEFKNYVASEQRKYAGKS